MGTAMDNFKADFKRKIAGLLTGVTADRIAITDVSAASVVVSFYIGPGPQDCPSTACAPSGQAMEEMLQLADDAAALDRAFPSSFEGLSPAPLLAGRAPPPAPSTSTSDSQLEAEEGGGAVVALVVVMVVLCGGGGGDEADGGAGGTYTEHVDAKGRTYYSEVATRKTVWKLPAGAVLVDPKGALEV